MFLVSDRQIKAIRNLDNWILALVFSVPAFFLVIKGWANAVLFLIFFICTWAIIKEPREFLINRGARFWVMFTCLVSPFLAELIAQIGRGVIVGSSLDGPARGILATGVFIYLTKRSIPHLITAISWGSAFGVLAVFLYLQILPEYYWGDRAATHFVDPITLPCFTFALLGLFLFGDYPKIPKNIVISLKLLMVVMATYVSLESASRSAWVAGTGLVAVYLLYSLRDSFMKQLTGVSILAAGVIGIFYFSEIFSSRLQDAYTGLRLFLDVGGGQSSSTGQRMILMLIDIELIKSNPFFGVGDGVMPTFQYLNSKVPSLTEEIYEIKMLAGSHSEFFAQMVRKGVFMGGLAIWSLFGYPVYLIVRELCRNGFLAQELQKLLGLIVPLIASGFTIQVFNLKMTTSFYMLLLAIFLAGSHMRQRSSQTKPK